MLDEIASFWIMPVDFYQASDKEFSIFTENGMCLAYFKKGLLEWVAVKVYCENMPEGFFESVFKTMQCLNRSNAR